MRVFPSNVNPHTQDKFDGSWQTLYLHHGDYFRSKLPALMGRLEDTAHAPPPRSPPRLHAASSGFVFGRVYARTRPPFVLYGPSPRRRAATPADGECGGEGGEACRWGVGRARWGVGGPHGSCAEMAPTGGARGEG